MKNIRIFKDYSPIYFFDELKKRLNILTDASVCKTFNISPSTISKIQHGHSAVSPEILLKIHEMTNIPIFELREMMQDKRRYFA
jgi:transcriptional regulator with XRE-family HTH domain